MKLGRDFSQVGSLTSIRHRLGNGHHHPYGGHGTLKLRYLSASRMAILSVKDGVLSVHNLATGEIERTIYSSNKKETADRIQAERAMDLLDLSRPPTSATDRNDQESLAPPAPAPLFSYLNYDPTDVIHLPFEVFARHCLALSDSDNCLQFLDLHTFELFQRFGNAGKKGGEFDNITAMCTFTAEAAPSAELQPVDRQSEEEGPQRGQGVNQVTFICTCEGALNHRLQIFKINSPPPATSHKSTLLPFICLGGRGTELAKFRNPVSVSFYLERAPDGKTAAKCPPPHPFWYITAPHTMGELEDRLYDPSYPGNFLVFQRPQEVADPDRHGHFFMHDLLFIHEGTKKLVHIVIGKNELNQFVSTQVSDEPMGYVALKDLVRAVVPKARLGCDLRPSALLAVADKGNSRVQIFRFRWEESLVFGRSLDCIYEIGGVKKKFRELMEPTAVAYSSVGELAVCDQGLNRIFIFNQEIEVLKYINLTYLSPSELQALNAKVPESRMPMVGPTALVSGNKLSFKTTGDYFDEAVQKISLVAAAERRSIDPKKYVSIASSPSSSAAPLSPRDRGKQQAPSVVVFSPYTETLAVGFRNGGILVMGSAEGYTFGALARLPLSFLDRLIQQYLTYTDVENLRNCCVFLHNHTRHLRLSWVLFPSLRELQLNLVVSLFIDWARISREKGGEATIKIDEARCERVDSQGALVCRRFLRNDCSNLHCTLPHCKASYDRAYLNTSQAFIEREEFVFFLSALFPAAFVWQYEEYIKEIFTAYSIETTTVHRHDDLARGKGSQALREKKPELTRIMFFPNYLEAVTVLEEHNSGRKDLKEHKLFRRIHRSCYSQNYVKPPVDLQTIDARVYIDRLEQYERKGVDVPFSAMKGIKFVTKKGMANAERTRPTPVLTHIDMCQRKVDQATALVDKLFN